MYRLCVFVLFFMLYITSVIHSDSIEYTYVGSLNVEYTTYYNGKQITYNKIIKTFNIVYYDDIQTNKTYRALYIEDIIIAYFIGIPINDFNNIKKYKYVDSGDMFFYSGDMFSSEIVRDCDNFNVIMKYNHGNITIIVENNNMCIMVQYEE